MGLALWLVPPPATSANLDALISSLATTHSSPTFTAHITLLTGIPEAPPEEVVASVRMAVEEWRETTTRRRSSARERAVVDQNSLGPSNKTTDPPTSSSRLASDDLSSPPPLLSFQALGSNASKYFQYLSIKITTSTSTPGPSLFDLRHAVRHACVPHARDAPDDFFPHLSLMYATDSGDENIGRAQTIMQELRRSGDVVEDGAGCEVRGIGGFRPEEILFIRAEGRPEEWEVLGRVSLL